MKKIYKKPTCLVADIAVEQLLCQSPGGKMGYSNEAATHSDNAEEEVLAKETSLWDEIW